jgi:hypothetical protein
MAWELPPRPPPVARQGEGIGVAVTRVLLQARGGLKWRPAENFRMEGIG